MNVAEIFSKISANQVIGLMLHNDLADYYTFLCVPELAKIHEKQFIDESREMRDLHSFYLKHYNMLIAQESVQADSHIPSAWRSHKRDEIGNDTKRTAIENGLTLWIDWESKTKKFLQSCYAELIAQEEIDGAAKICIIMREVALELVFAEELFMTMKRDNFS